MERKRTDTVPHYEPEALRRNIETCKVNIARMQGAINKEIDHINHLKKLLAEAEDSSGISI